MSGWPLQRPLRYITSRSYNIANGKIASKHFCTTLGLAWQYLAEFCGITGGENRTAKSHATRCYASATCPRMASCIITTIAIICTVVPCSGKVKQHRFSHTSRLQHSACNTASNYCYAHRLTIALRRTTNGQAHICAAIRATLLP